ncbi:hypothetical protein HMPREF2978_11110 [Corynebacterium sp. HMSC074C01]|uniref:hypothetical protein n=1 Tax=Corynebacterium sp. HMSC074C01 TaxID=1739482 RepID=UPI0008A634D2|nr:hypothetical protein [Corynebacterium sp. HMSC074C01]OFP63339.1 hypothetical protein HMPREF2978_11110 [Corynebacterium sp. HMSC074C01]
MSKIGQFITTVVIGGFAIVLGLLIALSMTRSPEEPSSTLGEALDTYPKNLSFSALLVPDVYGQDWIAGLVVCPGATEQQLGEGGVDVAGIDFVDGKVAEDENYFVTVSVNQEYQVEKLNRSQVDLCSGVLEQVEMAKAQGQDAPPLRGIQPGEPLQFLRGDDQMLQQGADNEDAPAWQFVG